ncbi:unnamed protein product, partial [marine sediment metagenome]
CFGIDYAVQAAWAGLCPAALKTAAKQRAYAT